MFLENDDLNIKMDWIVYNNFFNDDEKYCDFCIVYFDSYVNDNIIKIKPKRKIIEKHKNQIKYKNFFEGSIKIGIFSKLSNFQSNVSLKSYYDYKKYVYGYKKTREKEIPKDTILNIICFKYTKDTDDNLVLSQIGSSCIHLYDIYKNRTKNGLSFKGVIKYHNLDIGSYFLDIKNSKRSSSDDIKWMEFTKVNSNDSKAKEILDNDIKTDFELFKEFEITDGIMKGVNVFYNKNMFKKTPLESFILSNVTKSGSKFIEEALKYAVKRFSIYKNYSRPRDFTNDDDVYSKIWLKFNFEDKCNVICFFFSFPTIFIKYKNDTYDYNWKTTDIDDYTKNSIFTTNGDCDDKMYTILNFIKTIQFYEMDKKNIYFNILNEIKEILKLYIPTGNVWIVNTDRYSKKVCGHWNVVLIPIDYFMKNLSFNTEDDDNNQKNNDTVEKIKEITERELMMFENNIKKLGIKEKIKIINIEGTNIYPNYTQEDQHINIKNQFSEYKILSEMTNIIVHNDDDSYNFFLFSCIGVTLYFLERYKIGITKFYYMDKSSKKEKNGITKKNFLKLQNFTLKVNTIKSDDYIDLIYSRSKYNESIGSYISKERNEDGENIDKYEKFDIQNSYYIYEYDKKSLNYVGYKSENPINHKRLKTIKRIYEKIKIFNERNEEKNDKNIKKKSTISSSISLDYFKDELSIDEFFKEITEIPIVYNILLDVYTISNRTLFFFYISYIDYF